MELEPSEAARRDPVLQGEAGTRLVYTLIWGLGIGAVFIFYRGDWPGRVLLLALTAAGVLVNLSKLLGVHRLELMAGRTLPVTRMWMTTWSESRVVSAGGTIGPAIIPAGKPGADTWAALWDRATEAKPVLCVQLLSGHSNIHTIDPEPVDVLGTARPRGRILIRRSDGEMLWPAGRAKRPSRARTAAASNQGQRG